MREVFTLRWLFCRGSRGGGGSSTGCRSTGCSTCLVGWSQRIPVSLFLEDILSSPHTWDIN
eukprot:gene1680-4806_t